jgi:hypothetical protein
VTEVDADLGNGVVARQYQRAHNVVPPICNRENKFIWGEGVRAGVRLKAKIRGRPMD